MARIHITLVGGQRYPVYLGIIDRNPDVVVFVHSDKTQVDAEKIAEELPKNISISYEPFDPVDVEEIFDKAAILAKNAQENQQNEYSVNISGGTKLWSIAFYKYFINLVNAEIFYIDQNNYYWGLQPVSEHQTKVELKTDVVFRLNGQNVKPTNFHDFNQEDADTAKRLEELFDNGVFYGLVAEKNTHYLTYKQGIVEKNGNYLKWDSQSQSAEIKLYGKNYFLQSPHLFQLLFHFAWFEYQTAAFLSQWDYAKEILLNVKFSADVQNKDKNEVDVIVNTGFRLIFVECKTQITEATDIDKFRTVIKNFGGTGCKGLFLQREKLKPIVREKCAESGIICFSLKENKNNERSLFQILEKELFEINKK